MKKNLVIVIIIFLVVYLFSTKNPDKRSANVPSTGGTGGTSGATPTPDPEPENPQPEPQNTALNFTSFELGELPALIDGTNDVSAKNTLGFEVFPNINGQPRSNFVPLNIWGDGVEFLNHSGDTPPVALQKGLATGFDNAALNTLAAVPSEHRYKWTLFNDYLFWQKSHAELETEGANAYVAMLSQSRDSNGIQVPFSYTMLDIEGGVTDFSKISSFLKGYYNRAKADNPKHKVIFYGYAPNQGFIYWHSGYSYAGDNVSLDMKFFPYSKHEWNETKAKVSSGVMTDFFRGKDVMYNVFVSYSKQNLPLSTTMYEKAGGTFARDANGDRIFRNDRFSEVQRGETIEWVESGTLQQISTNEENNYGWYRLKPAVFHAVHQFAGYYSELYFRLQMIANECGLGFDFQNVHSVANPYGMIGILRHDLESNPFTALYRVPDRVNTQWHAGLVFTLLNNLSIWAGFTGGNVGLTKQGTYLGNNFVPDLHKTVYEGEPFNTNYFGEGFQKNMGHLGNYRQIAAKYYQMQAENRETGLWQKTDKILAFAHPEQIINGHFPMCGRLQGKYLKLHGIEARLDLGESFIFNIKNTKNSTVITKTIQTKKVLNELIVLPDGNYNAQDIYIEYTNPVKGGFQRVNGRGENIA